SGEPRCFIALSHGGHFVPRVSAKRIKRAAAGARGTSITSGRLFDGTHYLCGAGARASRISGEIPPAWHESFPGKNGWSTARYDRTPNGDARGTSCENRGMALA